MLWFPRNERLKPHVSAGVAVAELSLKEDEDNVTVASVTGASGPSRRAGLLAAAVLAATAVVASGCATTKDGKLKKETVELEPMRMVVVTGGDGTQRVESADPRDLFHQAGRAFEDGKFGRAATLYGVIVKDHSESRYGNVARFNAGLALEKQGQFAEALPLFESLAKRTKGSKDAQDALMHMALCNDKLRRHKAVIALMDRVLAPEYPDIDPLAKLEAHARRGKARHELRQLALAERDFKAALGLFKRHIANRALRRSYFVSLSQYRIGEIYRELFRDDSVQASAGAHGARSRGQVQLLPQDAGGVSTHAAIRPPRSGGRRGDSGWAPSTRSSTTT